MLLSAAQVPGGASTNETGEIGMAIGAIGHGGAGMSMGAVGFRAGSADSGIHAARAVDKSHAPSSVVSISHAGMGLAAGNRVSASHGERPGLYGPAAPFASSPLGHNPVQGPGRTQDTQFDRMVLDALLMLILAQQLQQGGGHAIR